MNQSPHPLISAVLLAAGRSRRMGAFKPLLPFGEVTVVERCVAVLREGGADEVLVGSSRVDLQACKLEYSIVSPK